MPLQPEKLPELLGLVTENPKYQGISSSLVERIARQMLPRYNSMREAAKAVRTKLHQLTGAYNTNLNGYAQDEVNSGVNSEDGLLDAKAWASPWLQTHASTKERLAFIDDFFKISLRSIAPVQSVLDLACGLNPLCIPWMPLADQFTYHACDVVLPNLKIVETFFGRFNIQGSVSECDLSDCVPDTQVQLALLLKTLPLLDQIDKSITPKLLRALNAEYVLISYPLKSLGGKSKGMEQTYRAQFLSLMRDTGWEWEEHRFPNELAFLVRKSG